MATAEPVSTFSRKDIKTRFLERAPAPGHIESFGTSWSIRRHNQIGRGFWDTRAVWTSFKLSLSLSLRHGRSVQEEWLRMVIPPQLKGWRYT